nr:protein adenylyltransferase SelO family protein [uncultured Cohaesibacter sp.]
MAISPQWPSGIWRVLQKTLVPLIDPENETRAVELATEALTGFMDSFKTAWSSLMGRKIGLSFTRPGDIALINQLMGTLQGEGVDFTLFFRHLSEGDHGETGRSCCNCLTMKRRSFAGSETGKTGCRKRPGLSKTLQKG